MSHDPLILVVQTEQRIEHVTLAVERPAPSVEQQQLADEVFSREQSQAVAAILAVQTGLVIAQHLVAETIGQPAEVEVPRRKKDEALEE